MKRTILFALMAYFSTGKAIVVPQGETCRSLESKATAFELINSYQTCQEELIGQLKESEFKDEEVRALKSLRTKYLNLLMEIVSTNLENADKETIGRFTDDFWPHHQQLSKGYHDAIKAAQNSSETQ